MYYLIYSEVKVFVRPENIIKHICNQLNQKFIIIKKKKRLASASPKSEKIICPSPGLKFKL